MLPYVEQERKLTGNDVGFVIQRLSDRLETVSVAEVVETFKGL